MSESETKSRVDKLAQQLLGDRAKQAERQQEREEHPPGECFACGRPYVHHPATGDDSSRFCSDRCRQWYDEGKAVFRTPPPWWQAQWRHVAGPPAGTLPRPMSKSGDGFLIPCAGCGRSFKSLGLKYCTPDCRKRSRERAENQAAMAEAGMDAAPAKRPCQHPGCPNTIPRWRNGRKVASNARFCARHSRVKERPKGGALSDA
jgi:hypothetical protein